MRQAPSLSEIIVSLTEISEQLSASNPELTAEINAVIVDLQKIESPSKMDEVLHRLKDISEIAAPFLKFLFDYFTDT